MSARRRAIAVLAGAAAFALGTAAAAAPVTPAAPAILAAPAASMVLATLAASPLAGAGAAPAAVANGIAAGPDTLAAGKRLFTQGTPACATCHTLRHAGAEGAIGPNLDELGPDAARVEKAVRNGIGVMPPFAGKLSDAEIRQLAAYVAEASRLP